MNAQFYIDTCDEPFDTNELKEDIRHAEFIANAREKFRN